jgi:hypothetical protein
MIKAYSKSPPIKFEILKMQLTDTRFKANDIEHRCPSNLSNVTECFSWLCSAALSCLFGSADMPGNFLSLVFDDLKGNFLRLSLSPFCKILPPS